VVIVNYDYAFPLQVLAVGALLLLLAFAFRRRKWAAYTFLILGTACMGGAAVGRTLPGPVMTGEGRSARRAWAAQRKATGAQHE